jgi:hypothetical protein
MYEDTPIPRDELLRALSAKCPARCFACGANDFLVLDEGNIDGQNTKGRTALIGFFFPKFDISTAKTIETVALSCNRCGTIWQVLRKSVTDWLGTNPKGP